MRLGACLLTLATPEDPLGVQFIGPLKQAGYDYAEVSLARVLAQTDEQIAAYRKLFSDVDLPVEAFNNSIPSGLPLVGPNFDKKVLCSYIERAVAVARQFGVHVITMCGPIRDWVPADFDWSVGFEQYVEFMKMYADEAAKYDILLAIEPINSEENGFISTVGEACKVIEACGRENIKVIVDFYHFFKQNDNWEQLMKLSGTMICHAHYAAQARRSFPLPADEEECRKVLRPFIDAGFNGRISVEAKTPNPLADIPQTRAVMRSVIG